MWKNSETKIGSGDYQMDARVQAMFDTRRGISLVLYPSAEVKENIASFLSDIYSYEPEQYYYPFSDIHITVLSVISCAENFLLNTINVQKYIDVLSVAMKTSRAFTISFQGVTTSSSCVMVQGFRLMIRYSYFESLYARRCEYRGYMNQWMLGII